MEGQLQKRNTVNGSVSIRTHFYFGKNFSKKFLLWKNNWIIPKATRRLPWWLSSKESTRNAGDVGSIPGSGRSPGEAHGNPLQYSCLENLMDRRLAGYGPWGRKESDATEATEQAHTQRLLDAKNMTTKDSPNRLKPQQG